MDKILTAKIDGREMDNDQIIDAILESRNIDNLADFLNPKESDLIPFEEMVGIEEAAQIINNTVDNNGKFLVFFDVDADGICGGAIVTRYLEKMEANVDIHIGKGKAHGLQSLPLEKLEGIDTLIIVDSINDNAKLYEKILDLGVTILVLDHHIIPQSLINANLDITLVSCMNDYPNTALSGSAVAWKTMAYIDYLNLTDYADDLIDLAATGLVGDMMDLSVPENRYICYEGFNNLQNPALKKIIGSYAFNSEGVSFSISPLVNACMRTENNEIAMQMFLSDDDKEISDLIQTAKEAKELQKDIAEALVTELILQGEEQEDRKCKVFFIPPEFHNLSGLLGNQLLSIFSCPLLVVHQKDGNIQGSMRAAGVADFAAMINGTGLAEAKGHELASGFECDEVVFDQFLIAIEEELKGIEFVTYTEADIELRPAQINEALVKSLASINRISGSGFKPVKVLVRTDNYEVSTFTSQKHLKIIDESGLLIVKWNTDVWQTMDNNGTIVAVGTIAAPYYGRTRYLQLTIDEYTKQND